MNFIDKLEKAQVKKNSLVCVGLDPDKDKIGAKRSLFNFDKEIIDKTSPYVSCFKPQIAYYAAEGLNGLGDLLKTINYIRKTNPDLPIICDAKRADIASTSEKYAQEIFDWLEFDAVTVNPYLGFDAIEPFLKRKEKGVIVLCRTSNKDAIEFQDLKVDTEPLFLKVAEKIMQWNKNYKNLLLVASSTWPEEIRAIRRILPKMIFLVPGIGSQEGNLKKTLEYGLRDDKQGLIISSSRGIIYAQDPAKAAMELRDEINRYRR